jgi:hypothetical protein
MFVEYYCQILLNYGDDSMNYKKKSLLIIVFSLAVFLFSSFLKVNIFPKVIATDIAVTEKILKEKRGIPNYDYIIGKDNWPHYRVFFWVPKNATIFTPYADSGVNTDVSSHGSVEKWSVVVTNEFKVDEKLVFIYIPKTFVFLYGKGFEDVIHLSYY